MALGKHVEAALDVPAGDGVEGLSEPVAEIAARVAAIGPVGACRAAAAGDDVVLAGVTQRGQGARAGGIVARGDAAQQFLGQAPCLVRGELPDTADDDALVGGLAPAVAGAVINKEGLRARGVHAHAEAGKLVVPGNPGLVVGLERVDGALETRPYNGASCPPCKLTSTSWPISPNPC